MINVTMICRKSGTEVIDGVMPETEERKGFIMIDDISHCFEAAIDREGKTIIVTKINDEICVTDSIEAVYRKIEEVKFLNQAN
jgi:hypothetical protein|tara:strand:+ start:478 stop:726 length:249 start_codon:yes stop_codon:yes gene_type:complete